MALDKSVLPELIEAPSSADGGQLMRRLLAKGWADTETIPGLASEWDSIAEQLFAAYRARRTRFQGQRRLRRQDFPLMSGAS